MKEIRQKVTSCVNAAMYHWSVSDWTCVVVWVQMCQLKTSATTRAKFTDHTTRC